MSRSLCTALLAVWVFLAALPTAQAKAPVHHKLSALVLYDEPASGQVGSLGHAHAIMLSNLLGHFDSRIEMVPASTYRAGQSETHDVTFYLGSTYDQILPPAFLKDAATSKRTIVWFKYNLWQLTRNASLRFEPSHGFTFDRVRGLNATPTNESPEPGFFSQVEYKGRLMDKFYRYDPGRNVVIADPDIGQVRITDPGRAQPLVPVINPKTAETVPYVVRSGRFWYFADIPLTYTGPRDRYLVLADLLHDIVGLDHRESHRAMIRLEDVSQATSMEVMDRITALLARRRIPFSVAAIPHYMNPLHGDANQRDVPLKQATTLKAILASSVARGGDIVAHGYTHQYDHEPNPHSAISGEDYEFWDARRNAPVKEDSLQWAIGRLRAARDEFINNGFYPIAWATPHYRGSSNAARAAANVFGVVYQRCFYFIEDEKGSAGAARPPFAVGQFFPYPVRRDYYGRYVVPENLGNVRHPGRNPQHDVHNSEVASSWQDLLVNAQYALVVRDGYASFFFHPYLVNSGGGTAALEELMQLLDGIDQLGYQWTSPRFLRPAAATRRSTVNFMSR